MWRRRYNSKAGGNTTKIALVTLGSLAILLALIVASVGYFTSDNHSTTETSPSATSPGGQLASDEQSQTSAAESPSLPARPTLDQEIESLKTAISEAAATNERKELAMVFTEIETNNKVAELLPSLQMPDDIPLEIESARIYFQPDSSICVEAQSVLYLDLEVTVKATGLVTIEEGQLRVELKEISLGFIPVPNMFGSGLVTYVNEKIKDALSQMVDAESGDKGRVNLTFRDISIKQDNITVNLLIEPSSDPIP